ncbi:hypothetical protein ACFPOA_06750 [Lysobacter niabensis]|uniref:hypothetical protein n=1 Tax=Agrilutibacter niabensis TaxID=380628 RepID=UPI00361B2F0C
MKQLILGLVATLAMGSAFAQQPTALVRAKGAVQVEVSGTAKVGDHEVASGASYGAKAGDMVVVSKGTAKVTYANGCAVTVEADVPYTISEKAPVCRAPAVAASSNTKYLAAGGIGLLLAGAAGGGGGGGGDDDKPSSP